MRNGNDIKPQLLIGDVPSMLADDVPTLSPDTSVVEAAKCLNQNRVGMAIVINAQDIVIGVLTKTDIVQVTAEWPSKIAYLKIKHLFSQNPVTCTDGDDAASILKLMESRDIHHIPLIEDKRLKGLVSYDNLRNYLSTSAYLENANPQTTQHGVASTIDHPSQHRPHDVTGEKIDWPEYTGNIPSLSEDGDFNDLASSDHGLQSDSDKNSPHPTQPDFQQPIMSLKMFMLLCLFIGGLFSLIATRNNLSAGDIIGFFGMEETLGEGLSIGHVTTSRNHVNEAEALKVRGIITNLSDQVIDVPLIRISLTTEDGNELQSAYASTHNSRIAAGAKASFQTSILNPSLLAKRIFITFAERPDESPQL